MRGIGIFAIAAMALVLVVESDPQKNQTGHGVNVGDNQSAAGSLAALQFRVRDSSLKVEGTPTFVFMGTYVENDKVKAAFQCRTYSGRATTCYDMPDKPLTASLFAQLSLTARDLRKLAAMPVDEKAKNEYHIQITPDQKREFGKALEAIETRQQHGALRSFGRLADGARFVQPVRVSATRMTGQFRAFDF